MTKTSHDAVLVLIVASAALLPGCSAPATPGGAAPARSVTLVPAVDLPRYMGDWYVIANIPTSIEKGASNAKESYRLESDGKVAITFTFNEDGFSGPLKTWQSTGSVPDPANPAVWNVQFVWPVQADYRISYLASDYRTVVVTREKRDYVWIMARTPTIPEADYERLVGVVGREGYDVTKLQRVPQAGGR